MLVFFALTTLLCNVVEWNTKTKKNILQIQSQGLVAVGTRNNYSFLDATKIIIIINPQPHTPTSYQTLAIKKGRGLGIIHINKC